MNKLILAFVAALLFLLIGRFLWHASEKGFVSGTPQNKVHDISLSRPWVQFDDPEGRFTVMLPSKPQIANENGLDKKLNLNLKYNLIVSESLQGNVFMVNAITYPQEGLSKISEDEITKKVLSDMMASNKENKLNEAKKSEFQGHNSFNFELSTPNKNVKTTSFMHENTVYVLSAVTNKNVDVENEFKYFLDHFYLINNK